MQEQVKDKVLVLVLSVIFFTAVPLIAHADLASTPLGTTGNKTGWGKTDSDGSATTWSSSSYYYQKVHAKGIGTAGGSPYCVGEQISSAYYTSYVSVPPPASSYSGYHVTQHYWYDYYDSYWSTAAYTSHDGNHSSFSNWNETYY